MQFVAADAFAQSVTTYTSEIDYLAALPTNNNVPTVEDFSTVVTNTLMSQTSGDVWNGFSVVAAGTSPFGPSGYCPSLQGPFTSTPTACTGYNTSAPDLPGIVGAFGTPDSGGGEVTFTPTGKVFAFAFEFIDWNDGSQRSSLVVNFSDGTSLPVTGPTNPFSAPPQFFGFIVDQDSRADGVHITSLNWVAITSELVGFYNVNTSRLLPGVVTTKEIAEPILQADGSYNVEMTIDSKNTGSLNLENLQLSDDIAAASNFGSVFVSVVGSPVISVIDDPGSSVVAVAPLAAATPYSGTSSQPNFFNGTSGDLGPGDIVRVVLTVKVDPKAAGAPDPLKNIAVFSAQDALGDMLDDTSDSTDPNDDTGGGDDPAIVVFPLLAVPESYASIDGAAGGDTFSILVSDTQYNAPVDPAAIIITVDAIDADISLDTSTGIITVPAGTSAGSYELTYTICEITVPANCSSTTEIVTVLGAPMLQAEKTVAAFVGAGSSTYMIPGNDVIYTITFTNVGDGVVDIDSIKLVDKLPVEIIFWNGDIDSGGPDNFTGSTPVVFSQSTGAGLTFDYTADVKYGFGTTAPADFASCSVMTQDDSYRSDVSFICFNPKGEMSFGTPDPTVSLSFRAKIK